MSVKSLLKNYIPNDLSAFVEKHLQDWETTQTMQTDQKILSVSCEGDLIAIGGDTLQVRKIDNLREIDPDEICDIYQQEHILDEVSAVHMNGDSIVVGHTNGCCLVVNKNMTKKRLEHTFDFEIDYVRVNKTGDMYVVVCEDSSVYVVKEKDIRPAQKRSGRMSPEGTNICELRTVGIVHDVQFSEDGKILAIADEQGISLWKTEDIGKTEEAEEIEEIEAEQILDEEDDEEDSDTYCLSFCGDLLASGMSDGTVKIWNIYTGRCVKTFRDKKDVKKDVKKDDVNQIKRRDGVNITKEICDVSLRRNVDGILELTTISLDRKDSLSQEPYVYYIKSWNTRKNKNTKSTVLITPIGKMDSVQFSNDGEKIIIHDRDHTLKIIKRRKF